MGPISPVTPKGQQGVNNGWGKARQFLWTTHCPPAVFRLPQNCEASSGDPNGPTMAPSVLGSRAPLIKRADLGDKGVYYRAMVGPFGSPEEASQFCGSLKTAGGQCVIQRN
jgi:hypothetical protein